MTQVDEIELKLDQLIEMYMIDRRPTLASADHSQRLIANQQQQQPEVEQAEQVSVARMLAKAADKSGDFKRDALSAAASGLVRSESLH